jgi:hypothetical protein
MNQCWYNNVEKKRSLQPEAKKYAKKYDCQDLRNRMVNDILYLSLILSYK